MGVFGLLLEVPDLLVGGCSVALQLVEARLQLAVMVVLASGFLVSNWLGSFSFTATIMHNIPEGFTMSSIMVTAGKGRGAALGAAGALGVSRIVGILAMALAQRWVTYGLALSAGVTLYVAASDLIPEVNKMGGVRMTLTVAAGVALVLLLRLIFIG